MFAICSLAIMEPCSIAASIFTIIPLAAKILEACDFYTQTLNDGNTRDQADISALQAMVAELKGIAQKYTERLQDPHSASFRKYSPRDTDVSLCLSYLRDLEEKINVPYSRSARYMTTLGIKTSKSPLARTEVDRIVQDLERFKLSFISSLESDET